MTMSTYKSLGGPAGGLIVSNDAELAEQLDTIAFPGMTANFDAGKSAALAMTLLDWRDHGADYAQAMVDVAQAFAAGLEARGVKLFQGSGGFTQSHQFAIEAAAYGGGQRAAKHLRRAGFLTCGIGLPIAEVAGDLNGLRIGTPEIVRFGVGVDDLAPVLDLFVAALNSKTPEALAGDVAALRGQFRALHFVTA
jgi:glycine hydroxymethyltransferase